MTSSFVRSPDGTITTTLVFTVSDMESAYKKVVDKAVADTEIQGFRKGKAPRELIESKLSKSDTYSQALKDILPKAYESAVTEHNLKPILYPKINIKTAEEGKDWIIEAVSCEAPAVTLPDYKSALPKIEIKDPGSKLSSILEYLSKNAQVNLSQLLIEEETNHRLAGLAENLTSLGMTTPSYLASKKLTLEELKNQYATQAKTDLTVEFALAQIQHEEKLADRSKTLDFLTGLV